MCSFVAIYSIVKKELISGATIQRHAFIARDSNTVAPSMWLLKWIFVIPFPLIPPPPPPRGDPM